MLDTTRLSRIARSLTLRRAELATHTASVIAVALTVLMVGTDQAKEVNPVSAALIHHSSPLVWAVATPLGIAAIFATLRLVERDLWPRLARGYGWLAAGLASADAVGNVYAIHLAGLPETVLWEPLAAATGTMLLLVGLAIVRPSVPRPPTPGPRQRQAIGAVAFAVLLVLSPIAGPLASVIPDTSSPIAVSSAAQGDEKWNTTVEENAIATEPSVAKGRVFFTDNHTLHALDASDGSRVWTHQLPGRTNSSVIWANDRLFVGTGNGYVVAVDPKDGSRLWTLNVGGGVGGSPTYDNKTGNIYVGVETRVMSIDASDGTVNWNKSVLGDSAYTTPVVKNGTVYIGSIDNKGYAVDKSTGSLEWSTSDTFGDILGPFVATNNTVLFASRDTSNNVYAVYANNGSQRWSKDFAGGTAPEGLTLYNGSAYMVLTTTVYKFDPKDGSNAWSKGLGESGSTPTFANNTVYVTDGDGQLNAINASSGSLRWSVTVEADSKNLAGPPTVWAGDVYFGGGSTGKFYAYQTRYNGDSIGQARADWVAGHAGPGGSYPSPGSTVSGTVVNQRGNPCVNCTVQVIGVDHSQISTGPAESLEERANELLARASNVTPDEWNRNLQLTGSRGKFQTASAPYVAVHSTQDWGLAVTTDPPDLDRPLLQVPANQEIALSVWDPGRGDGLAEDGVNSQLPGKVVDNTDIIIEPLASTDEAVARTAVSTDTTYDLVIGGSHDLAKLELSPGFYRVYPRGHPETSYVIVAGDPDQVSRQISTHLNNTAEELTQRAQNIQARINNSTFTRTTVTTNATGYFSVNVGSNTKTVAIQAFKTPPGSNINASTANISDIRTFWLSNDFNGSVVLPAGTPRFDTPATNVTVEVREYRAPQYSNVSDILAAANATAEFLRNQSLSISDIREQLQTERIENIARRLRNQRNRLANVIEQYEVVEAYYCQAGYPGCQNGEISFENTSNTTRLREQIAGLQEAAERAPTRQVGQVGDISIDNATRFLTQPLDLPVNVSDVSALDVVVSLSNGETRTISDEHLSYENGTAMIDRWPVPEGTQVSSVSVDFPDQDVSAPNVSLPDPSNVLNRTIDTGTDLSTVSGIEVYAVYQDSTREQIPSSKWSTSGTNLTITNFSLNEHKDLATVDIQWDSSNYETSVPDPTTVVNRTLHTSAEVNVSQITVTAVYADGTTTTIPASRLSTSTADDGVGTDIHIDDWQANQSKTLDHLEADYSSVTNTPVNYSSTQFLRTTMTFSSSALGFGGADVQDSDLIVSAHYQDGTVRPIPPEYYRVNNRVGRSDQVIIEGFPLTGNRTLERLTVAAATTEGFSRVTVEPDQAENASTASGTESSDAIGPQVEIESLVFSERLPGPEESVSVTVEAADAELTDVDVVGPSGATLNHTQTGTEVTFTTNGTGQHELTFRFAVGNETAIVTETIRATDTPRDLPPSVRQGEEYPVGTGLEAVSQEVRFGGRQVGLGAVIAAEADVPPELRYYAESTSARKTTYDLSILRGTDRTSINQHVKVRLFLPRLPESALVYRECSGVTDTAEPLTRKDNPQGTLVHSPNQTVVKTYTCSDGRVEIRTVLNPTFAEQANYWVRKNLPDLPVGVLVPVRAGAPLVVALVVVPAIASRYLLEE